MSEKRISAVTRTGLFDALAASGQSWNGRLDDIAFLSRLYDLTKLPSLDSRFRTAEGDIRQHRLNWSDWGDDWIFSDPRFNLIHGSDDELLNFLCLTLHPSVRPDIRGVRKLLRIYNEHLKIDGFEIYQVSEISGRPVFAARPLSEAPQTSLNAAKRIADRLDTTYLINQITRMEASIANDPEAAIGAAKDFIETVCKFIVRTKGGVLTGAEDLPKLAKLATSSLDLVSADVANSEKNEQALRKLTSNLISACQIISEIRGLSGSGHGKEPGTVILASRHARFVVGCAAALGVFLIDSLQDVDREE